MLRAILQSRFHNLIFRHINNTAFSLAVIFPYISYEKERTHTGVCLREHTHHLTIWHIFAVFRIFEMNICCSTWGARDKFNKQRDINWHPEMWIWTVGTVSSADCKFTCWLQETRRLSTEGKVIAASVPGSSFCRHCPLSLITSWITCLRPYIV